MTAGVDAPTVKAWLSDGAEIAFLDVREHGQFGEGHPFFATPLPYSRFELGMGALVPKPDVRLVLSDAGDGVAERAARRAEHLGYRNLHIMQGGAPAWARAGFTLYAGVNVPSKTFGELVERARHTPRVTAQELEAMRRAQDNFVVVDGRPFSEYAKMNIPGGICCPNGELALRIGEIAPDPETTIIVNCAGRTRSIIGAQTLIDIGVPNRVYALENGTQGWFLAGLDLERGADRYSPDPGQQSHAASLKTRAQTYAKTRGVGSVTSAAVNEWLIAGLRTVYLLDVRTPEENAAAPITAFAHAPGGQLIQATDQWVGVKGAALVLADDDGIRAPVIAGWLRQLGHEAFVLAGGLAATKAVKARQPKYELKTLQAMAAAELAGALGQGTAQAIDIRSSTAYRNGHIAQGVWSIRPRIARVADPRKKVVLISDVPQSAALAAIDLTEAGCKDICVLAGGMAGWREAGFPVLASAGDPPDADCIDFLFFTHKRHDGDADAARRYLSWETGLLDQLDTQERAAFRISAA